VTALGTRRFDDRQEPGMAAQNLGFLVELIERTRFLDRDL
jgi:hypothetical protein